MSITFNADEVFEMAEEIERNGAKFYRRAAEKTADSGARDRLLGLAVMEDGHEKTFTAMRADLSVKESMSRAFDPDNEAVQYLRVMADDKVFDLKADPSAKLTGQETTEEIYQTAIGLEKDSIVFYQGIKEIIPEKMGKDKIDLIIREEMGHITLLSEQLTSLRK